MQRNASARWQGDLKTGKGTLSTGSGVLADAQYSFHTRFENEPGTNPEELIGAAHAGCFSMALSKILAEAGHTAEQIDTKAAVSLEQVEAGFAITKVHLDVVVKAPGAGDEALQQAAGAAKAGCPVSKVLNAEISMSARLAD